jgi:hypothetical protein
VSQISDIYTPLPLFLRICRRSLRLDSHTTINRRGEGAAGAFTAGPCLAGFAIGQRLLDHLRQTFDQHARNAVVLDALDRELQPAETIDAPLAGSSPKASSSAPASVSTSSLSIFTPNS